jgi:hypothetical protein
MSVPRMIAGIALRENINPDLLPGVALNVGLPVKGACWRWYTRNRSLPLALGTTHANSCQHAP